MLKYYISIEEELQIPILIRSWWWKLYFLKEKKKRFNKNLTVEVGIRYLFYKH